jgi:hypothetical protein
VPPVPKNLRNKNREFLDWIARQPCCTCGSNGVEHNGEYLVTPSHVRSRGAGGGDEGNVVPHCMECHHKLGKWGPLLFRQVMRIDLHRVAKEMWEKWESLNLQNKSASS